MTLKIILSTYPDLKSAEYAVSTIIKEKRLAACANLVKIDSRYIWKNQFEESEEYLVFFKTTKDKIDKLKEEVENQHPYGVPEIIEIPVLDVNSKYLNWLNTVIHDD